MACQYNYNGEWVTEDELRDIFANLGGLVQTKASPKTIAKMKQWLDKAGISLATISTESEKMAFGDVNGVAILLDRVIKVAEGKESEALTEEAMHFLTAMIKQGNRELYNKMMNRIGSMDMYTQVKKAYKDDQRYKNEDGSLNVIKLKEETIGKVLAEYQINGDNQEDAGLLARLKSWWAQILSWLQSLVTSNGDPFSQAIKEMDTIDPSLIDKERIQQIAKDINDNYSKGNFIHDALQEMYNEGKYTEIVQEIGAQLNDKASYLLTLENLGFNEKLVTEILTLRGEYAQLQEQPNPFKAIKDRNKEYNLTKHEDNNDVDDENKGSYYTITIDGKNQVIDRVTDKAKRDNKRKGGRDYLAEASEEQQETWKKIALQGTTGHSDIENIINQAIDENGELKPRSEISLLLKKATNSGIYNKFVQYLLGDDTHEGFLSTFPAGTKFNTELQVLDPGAKSTVEGKQLVGRAGTIDLLAILPDGSGKIYDWKFMGLLLNKPDQNFLKRTQHAIQLGEYKRILGTLGIKNVQGFTIPIHAEYKYLTDKDTGEKVPILNDVAMGSVRMKDEERTPLLSVVPEGQSSGNEQVDILVKRLTAKYNRVWKKPTTEDEYDNKKDILNQLSTAIRNLQVALNFDPLAAEAINYTNSVNAISEKYKNIDFSTYTKEQKDAAIEDLQDSINTSDYYSSIDEAFISQYGTTNLSDKQKATLDSLRETSAIAKEKADELIKVLERLVDTIAKNEDFNNYLTPEKEAANLTNSFTETGFVPVKSLQLATRIIVRERSNDSIKINHESDKFKDLYLAAIKENGHNIFDIIADKNTHQLIPIVEKKFYNEMKQARQRKDVKYIKDNINYDAYKTALKDRIEKKVKRIDDTTYSTDEKQNKKRKDGEKIRAYKQLDFTNPGFFGWEDREFLSLIRNTQKDLDHKTTQYSSLKPAALALHEYFVSLNEKAKEAGYLKREHSKLFLPFITGTMLQRLNQNGGKLSSLRNSIADQFLVQDIDKTPYGRINEETGELERNVPVYFTSNFKDINDYSKDLSLLGTKYIQALQEYETSTALENTFLALHKVEQNKGHLQTERGKVIFEGEKPKIFEGNEKNANLLQKYIDDQLYGVSEENDTLVDKLLDATIKKGNEEEKSNKKLSIKKTIQFGNLMTQQLAVGFKALVAIPNYVGAHIQSSINSSNYFNAGEYFSAHGRVVTSSLTNIEKGCMHFLVPLNENIGLEKRREIARKESLSKYLGTWTFNDAMMSTNRIPDKAHELTNALVWMRNTMLDENGNLVNIRQYYKTKIADRYDKNHENLKAAEKKLDQDVKDAKEKLAITKIAKFDEAGNFIIPGLNSNNSNIAAYRAKVIEYGRYITGQMSRENKADYRRNIIARSFMMFKNWIPKQVSLRALDIHKNPILDEWEYGRTRLFFKTWTHLGWQNILKIRHLTNATPEGIKIMREMLEEKKEDYFKKTGQQLEITDAEFFDMVRKELKSEYKELAILIGLLGMILTAKLALPPDDDDKSKANFYKQTLRAINKVSDELYFYWSPTSAQSITRGTVLPSLAILSKVISLGEHVGTEIFAVNWKKGEFFDKDIREKNNTLKYFIELTPIASQFSSEILPIVDPELSKSLGYHLTTISRPTQ